MATIPVDKAPKACHTHPLGCPASGEPAVIPAVPAVRLASAHGATVAQEVARRGRDPYAQPDEWRAGVAAADRDATRGR